MPRKHLIEMKHFLILFLTPLIGVTECRRDYSGCKVFLLTPSTLDELKAIQSLQHKYQDETQISFWSHASDIGEDVNVLSCPLATRQFLADLELNELSHQVHVEDIQPIIEHERDIHAAQLYRRTITNSTRLFQDFQFDSYYSIDEIHNFLTAAVKYKPDLVSVTDAGTTYEKRKVKIIKLGKDTGVRKPAIWIDAGIHAREWIAPASAMYMIYQLLTSKDNETKGLLDDYDWYFIPVLNPDGYAYTWQQDRLWRKNRARSTLICRGVDLNRNFDADFEGKKSSSTYPCSETYRGPLPFSEEETKIVRDYISSLKTRLKMVLTVHSFSQMWLFPYGHTAKKAPDHDELLRVSTVAMDALTRLHGTKYRFGNIAKVIYPASGSLTDWVYDSAGIKYSFAAELRDTGKFGFLLPTDQIIPTCQEFWAAVKALIGEISKEK